MIKDVWKGCFISESLVDPTILNNYHCSKIRITGADLPIDDKGTKGRWHMYWIEVDVDSFHTFEQNMKYNWYGHFWKGNNIKAIFENRIFDLEKEDKTTWTEAIEYGKTQGIPEEQLDFLIE